MEISLQTLDPESGERFRTACKQLFGAELSNIALSEKFGCSEAAVRNWMQGATLNGILIKLLGALGVSERYLLHGKGAVLAVGAEHIREIGPDLREYLHMLKELQTVLHDYELEAVRGAMPVEDFGAIVKSLVENLGASMEKMKKRKKRYESG